MPRIAIEHSLFAGPSKWTCCARHFARPMALAALAGTLLAAPLTAQTWVPTSSMTTARAGFTTTRLQDGKVLVAGGGDNIGNYLSSAELYDPSSGTFTPTGNMLVARANHTATLLNNGMVLIVGGANSSTTDAPALSSAELYDPTTGTFSATGSLNTGRWGHTATLLNDGKVLIAGGFPGPGCCGATFLSSAEVYDPTIGTFHDTGNMNYQREGHTATLLSSGQVLIAGGSQYTFQGTTISSAELYDPTTGSFTPTGSMLIARTNHTATLLGNGRVLIVGGSLIGQALAFPSAELYDPSTGIFESTGGMATARLNHTATLLNNGLVLIAGGDAANSGAGLASSELYDPTSGTFSSAGNMTTPREGQKAALLGNGTVLVAGGSNNGTVLQTAELFSFASPTTTTLTSSSNPSVFGQTATLTATVSPGASATGTPSGTVTFSDGATILGTESLTDGQATFATSALSVGPHSISAAYSGDTTFEASMGGLTQTVDPASTTTTASSSASPSILNSPVSLTAAVSVVAPGAGTPTGSVTFKDESTVLATVALDSAGQATFSSSSFAVGSHSLTVVYSGDSDFGGSTSPAFTQSVRYEPAGSMCDGDVGHQILQPISSDGTSVFQQGRTVPAKFRVCDANGVSVGTTGVVASFFLTQVISGTTTTAVENIVDTSNPDTAFRWDATNQQWVFNIATQSLSSGSTYVYTIVLNDGTTINFQYGLR